MAFPRKLRELCTPAMLYFTLSVLGLVMLAIQNMGNSNIFSMGSFSAKVPSTTAVFIVKLVYILFWTWVLNLMCKDGHSEIAWFLILIPFIIMFMMAVFLMGNQ